MANNAAYLRFRPTVPKTVVSEAIVQPVRSQAYLHHSGEAYRFSKWTVIHRRPVMAAITFVQRGVRPSKSKL